MTVRVAAATTALFFVLLSALSTADGAEPTPSPVFAAATESRAAVTLYRMPPVPPTGGTEALTVDSLGRIWFDEHFEEAGEPGEPPRFPGEIVRMDRAGAITPVLFRTGADDFASAADGSVWYLQFRAVSRIAPDGTVSRFPMPQGAEGGPTGTYRTTAEWSLVIGPDGNVWFGGRRHPLDEEGREAGSESIIGRLTQSGELSEFRLPNGGGFPTRLAVGPDGNVWFTAAEASSVGYVTPAGQIQEFPLSPYAFPNYIAGGRDGVWFTEDLEGSVVARITPSGEIYEFRISGDEEVPRAGSLAAGPDGRIWFAAGRGQVGRIDSAGRLSKIQLPQQTAVEDLVVGPEGSLWYASLGEPRCQAEHPGCSDGAYAAGIIGRIDPAPLSVAIDGGSAARRGRAAKIGISCLDGGAKALCRGHVRLRAGRHLVGKRRFTLGTDDSRGFSVPLGERARTELARTGHLGIRCAVTLAGGRTEVRALRLRLRTHQAASLGNRGKGPGAALVLG